MNADSNRLCEDCGKTFTGHYSSVCPHNPKPAPPVSSMTDAMLAERVWSGDRWTYPNLTTLRQRLAEAEKYGAPVAGAVALSYVKNPCTRHNAYWTTSSGACMACRAMVAEDLLAKAQADAARWEGAARKIASMPMPDHLSETMARELLREAITTASALVREGGAAALIAAKESKQ